MYMTLCSRKLTWFNPLGIIITWPILTSHLSTDPLPVVAFWLGARLVLRSHPKGLQFNRLSQFFSFLFLSDHFRLWTVRRFSKRTHLSHALHHFTNTCSPHGKPCSIKLNLILDSSFLCCAWLCCHTHVLHTCLCFSSIVTWASRMVEKREQRVLPSRM